MKYVVFRMKMSHVRDFGNSISFLDKRRIISAYSFLFIVVETFTL